MIKRESSRLPDGYTEYDYLYSSATTSTSGSYINTGIVIGTCTTLTLKIDCKTDGTLTTQQYPIGNRQNKSGNPIGFAVGLSGDKTYFLSFSEISARSDTSNPTDRHTLIGTWTSDSVSIQVDDEQAVVQTGTTRPINVKPICLFGIKHYQNATGGTPYFFRGKIYYAEAVKDGVKIMECYPCVRDSDSKVGVYDVVNSAFYGVYNYSGRSVVAGNE